MRNSLFVVLPGVLGLFTSMIVPSLSSADDAAKQASPSRQELETLWSDLYADDPAAANAVITLYKNPDTSVPFLKEKLQPLILDADKCRTLLQELGDDDEKVWKAAWEELDYLDPRLAIHLTTLMDEVTDVPARTRMVELCSQRPADSLAGKNVILRTHGDYFNFFDGSASWWAEHLLERIGINSWDRKMAWTRAVRAVAVLEQINTPEAVKVLKQLAEGHPKALPTKAAEESLARLLPEIDPFGKTKDAKALDSKTSPASRTEGPGKQPPTSDGNKTAKNRLSPTHVRDVETGSRHAEAIAFTSDAQYMLSGGFNQQSQGSDGWMKGEAVGVLQITDLESGKVVATFEGTAGAILGTAISPNRKLVATGGRVRNEPRLGEVILWDFNTKKQTLVLKGHTNWVLSVAFSPDGRFLASGGFDKVARVWEVTSGNLIAQLPEQDGILQAVAFSPDGMRLATATRRGVVTLWEVATWKKCGGFSKEGYFVTDLAFSPDGKWLAMAGMIGGEKWIPFDVGGNGRDHGLALLYELEAEGPVEDVPIAGGLTTAVSFSSDSKLLGTLSMPQSRSVPGGTAIYGVADRKLLAVIPKADQSSADHLRFLPWGRTVATTDFRGIVSFWKLAEP